MKKALLGCLMACVAGLVSANGIEGKWRTVDDETGKPKAVVQISKNGATYSGTIVELMSGVENVCPACKGNQPLKGLTVLTGLKEKGNKYEDGKIFDPKGGKTYSAKAEVSGDGKTLKVRGYVGISVLGRTQTWHRVQ